jgi:His/Glu/Gln/Arg/opine family amino acid ABC transporter permease subunit
MSLHVHLVLGFMYQLRWEYVLDRKDWFIDGLVVALWMAVIGLFFGSIIGLICAFARSSKNRIATILITAYVEFVRNIPLLLLVFLFYFGLPQAFPRHSWQQEFIVNTALPTPRRTFEIALAFYSGAYLTEIFSSGILSVSKVYHDAGRSLGLTRFQRARYVTSPIMFRTVLPSLSNTFISLFKDTSIAFFIGVEELSRAANKINTDFFRPIEGWAAAGLLYLATAWTLAIVLRFLEHRIKWSV